MVNNPFLRPGGTLHGRRLTSHEKPNEKKYIKKKLKKKLSFPNVLGRGGRAASRLSRLRMFGLA